ncbi:MAG TPA: hypothetical protein VLS48_06470, partial [Anaerolineales bacterium]|nr:hypothetical protein [Anaerolineales bacterium]
LVASLLPVNWFLALGEQATWRAAISLALLGFLLSLPLKRLMSAAAAVLAGGFFALTFPEFIGYAGAFPSQWLFILGGAVGLSLFLFSAIMSLMVLSTLVGALLIVQSMPSGPFHPLVLFGLLFFVGIGLKYALLQWGEPSITR